MAWSEIMEKAGFENGGKGLKAELPVESTNNRVFKKGEANV